MQPIERYGVVALLFLIVTIGAVVLWDRSEGGVPGDNEVAAAERNDELAGLSRQRGSQPRLPADPKGPQVRREDRTKRHQAGSTPSGLEVQEGSWVKGRKQPDLATKPAPEPKSEPLVIGGGQPSPGPKSDAPKFDPRVPPSPQPGSGLAGGLVQPKPRVDPEPARRTYTVVSGDTLGEIAQDQLGSIKHLKALEAANPKVRASSMSVGTVLVLPQVGSTGDALAMQPEQTPAKDEPAPAPAPSGRTHTVAAGESLWSIAEARLGKGTRYTELQTLNPGAGSTLKVGQVLRLPAGAGLAASKPENAVAKADTEPRRKRGVVR